MVLEYFRKVGRRNTKRYEIETVFKIDASVRIGVVENRRTIFQRFAKLQGKDLIAKYYSLSNGRARRVLNRWRKQRHQPDDLFKYRLTCPYIALLGGLEVTVTYPGYWRGN